MKTEVELGRDALVARFVCHAFPRHASISQEMHNRKSREKETVLQFIKIALNHSFRMV